MNTAPSRKWRERQLLDAFIQCSRIDAVITEEREAPDFIVQIDGRRVGVELTELFVEDDGNVVRPKARESLAAKVVAEARRLYESRGGSPLHVSVGFLPNIDFRKLERAATALTLAEFLLGQDIPPNGHRSWGFNRNSPLPSVVHFVSAFSVPNLECAHWYAPQAGWIAPLTEAILQSSIETKAAKLASYRAVTSEIWLVLVAAGGAPSQAFERKPELCWEAIRSPFSRTFFVSLIDSDVHEIGKRNAA
jgi:hypothetical protein